MFYKTVISSGVCSPSIVSEHGKAREDIPCGLLVRSVAPCALFGGLRSRLLLGGFNGLLNRLSGLLGLSLGGLLLGFGRLLGLGGLVVAEKGFSVCYDSASAALESYERAKFGRDTEDGEAAALRVRRMESCDLMILDDLGTEMITPMSLSALYTLINTRLVNGRKMIISTNCSEEDLAKKYTPQICSRIAGEFIALPFVGQDIRKLKRGI